MQTLLHYFSKIYNKFFYIAKFDIGLNYKNEVYVLNSNLYKKTSLHHVLDANSFFTLTQLHLYF